jgi:hypothetical protein
VIILEKLFVISKPESKNSLPKNGKREQQALYRSGQALRFPGERDSRI